MTVLEIAHAIGIHPETLFAIEQHSKREDIENKPMSDLIELLDRAIAVKERYHTLGISEKVYWDSLKDIAIWSRDYLENTGRHGVWAKEWLEQTLQMHVFRLGRLQFACETLDCDIRTEKNYYPKETCVLEIHIPTGEPLVLSDVQRSLQQSTGFFEKYFGKKCVLFRCRSWLLAPELRQMLSENSGIIAFQNLFTIYKVVPHIQGQERVFGHTDADPSAYPENTALQRKMKAYLLAGNKTTMGYGIIECGSLYN